MTVDTRRIWLAIAVIVTTTASSLDAQRAPLVDPSAVCARVADRRVPAKDLYCIDLVPAPDFPDVAGAVELRRVPTPFGTAVTRDGHHAWDLSITILGLPDPDTLANDTRFMAWATPPTFSPMIRLGEVQNGR